MRDGNPLLEDLAMCILSWLPGAAPLGVGLQHGAGSVALSTKVFPAGGVAEIEKQGAKEVALLVLEVDCVESSQDLVSAPAIMLLES